MKTAFLLPGDPRWKGFLQTCPHDFYHIPEYVTLCAKYENASPVAFYAEDEQGAFLAPLLIKPVPAHLGAPEGWYDAGTPYGYPTPLVTPSGSSPERFLETFKLAARERHLVTAFFRFHPLLGLNHQGLERFGQMVRHGQTVFIDLLRPAEEIRRAASENHKRNIRKLSHQGFSVSVDRWELFEDFVAIYLATMQRVGASEIYLFCDGYFEELRTALGDRLHLCSVLSPNGDVAASGLFVETEGMVQYHLGGTAREYLALAPSKLMFDVMPRWAQQRKNTVFHLGGGLGGSQDPLFHFKAGFSKERADFFTYRMVLDQEKSDWLLLCAKAQRNGADVSYPNFFPAYRTPAFVSKEESKILFHP